MMLLRTAKALSRRVPYLRRVQDGMEAMRLHIAALERDLAQRDTTPTPDAALECVPFIDEGWCDAQGVFLRGWVHAGPHAVQRVTVCSGSHRTTVTPFGARPDVVAHYPHIPAEGAAAFTAYLACPPFAPVTLEVETPTGIARAAVTLPSTPDVELRDASAAIEQFMAAMKDGGGTVLELGARIVGSMTEGWRPRLEPGCRYLANDIHPGSGIDLVGDVHALTRHVEPGSLDGIFSIAVLEHLVAPWVAAQEINRALRPGGETLHVTHQTWPLHETPNDFFRMSDQALNALFGPGTGFEVIESGMAYPVSIVPPPHMRHSAWLRVPVGRGYGQSYIRARKVREIEATAGDAGFRNVSLAYPLPG